MYSRPGESPRCTKHRRGLFAFALVGRSGVPEVQGTPDPHLAAVVKKAAGSIASGPARAKNKIEMKKVMSIIAVAAITTAFVACGPSAEEKAKAEEQAKRVADSITKSLEAAVNEAAAATTAAVDSAAAPAAETTTAAPAEKH